MCRLADPSAVSSGGMSTLEFSITRIHLFYCHQYTITQELKKKELEELDAVFAELGIAAPSAEASQQQQQVNEKRKKKKWVHSCMWYCLRFTWACIQVFGWQYGAICAGALQDC